VSSVLNTLCKGSNAALSLSFQVVRVSWCAAKFLIAIQIDALSPLLPLHLVIDVPETFSQFLLVDSQSLWATKGFFFVYNY
jgi:hypothetical protein